MASVLQHRGAHGNPSEIAGAAGLGCSLTWVNREDRYERQPLQQAGLMLVADCRLDNRDELAGRLSIPAGEIDTMPDSALILAAYRRWGEGCAAELLGDFAFAIWDEMRGRLLLARDHTGQRYVHYHAGGGVFSFATEAKALLALPGVPLTINEGQLARQIMRDPDPGSSETLFQGIKGLAGGTIMMVDADGTIAERRYWRPQAAPEHLGRDEAYYIEHYRGILEEAVACRVRRLIDPPGLMLSGGFDSGAIAGLAAPALPSGQKLVSITSTIPEGEQHAFDARPGAEACRRHMPHLDHSWHVNCGETPLDDFDRRAHALDRPPMPLNQVTSAMLATLRRKGARMVMDGIGGDSTLNPRGMRALSDLLKAGRFIRLAREVLWEHRLTGARIRSILLWHVMQPSLPRRWQRRLLRLRTADKTGDLVHPYAAASFVEPLIRKGDLQKHDSLSLFDQRSNREHRLKTLALLQARAQPNLANEAAAHGLALTRPMLDKRVVEFGLAIPDHLHVVKGRNRYLARRALAGVLPPEFQTRPRMQEYFEPRLSESIRAALPQMREGIARMQASARLRKYYDLDRMAADAAADPHEAVPDGKPSYLMHTYLSALYVARLLRENV